MADHRAAQIMLSPEDNQLIVFQALFLTLSTQQPTEGCAVLVRDWCFPMLQIRTLRHREDEFLMHKTNQGLGGNTDN